MVRIEVCVESTSGAKTAALGGADRIELCAALELGGITPSAGLIEAVVDVITTHVLIRPRGGDFCYDKHEIRVMAKDVEHAIDRGAESVAIGALTADGRVDMDAMVRLLGAAGEVPVTFHRAFDSVVDPFAALDDLMELGVDRLLTSGCAQTAAEGAEAIAEFVRRCGDDLCVMPGSGVAPDNAAALILSTGAREIHCSAKSPVVGSAPLVKVGPHDGGQRFETDLGRVRAIVTAVSEL
ncbi:copper homeostasis protein [Nakamurella sp. UYEF19]|uniref:copper homeostasis protein CutC n=1 Tax=Nakamurella sp. UYEF19 TaxID=1756392 RepID=UPI003392AC11